MVVLITRFIITVGLLAVIGGACYSLHYVWTNPVSIFEKWKREAKNNFPTAQKTIIPSLDYEISYLPTKYASGLEVDGVIWKEGYEEYRLFVRNKNRSIEVYDVRISMDLLGGIVQHKILSEAGCSGLKARDSDMIGGGIGKKDGVIEKTVKQYSNNFFVTADKLFPDAYFNIRLILKVTPSVSDVSLEHDSGIFDVTYRYVDSEQKMQVKSEIYKIIPRKDGSLYIDTQNPLSGKVMRSSAIVFDTPLYFGKDGSIEKENSK